VNDFSDLASELALGFALGQRASEVALPLFQRGGVAHQKPDGSLVTEADTEVEQQQLLLLLAAQRPDDAVLSEECGDRTQP
jgi:histidinol-phosphatase